MKTNQAIQKKRTLGFILLTFVLSWSIGFFAMAQGITLDGLMGAESLEAGQLAGMAALSLYMWMPALGSILIRALTGQRFHEMKLSPRPRQNWKYDLLGWFAPFGFALTGTVSYFAFFSDRFDHFEHLKQLLGTVLGVSLEGLPAPVMGVLLLLAAAITTPLASLLSGPLGGTGLARVFIPNAVCLDAALESNAGQRNRLGRMAYAAAGDGLGLRDRLQRLSGGRHCGDDPLHGLLWGVPVLADRSERQHLAVRAGPWRAQRPVQLLFTGEQFLRGTVPSAVGGAPAYPAGRLDFDRRRLGRPCKDAERLGVRRAENLKSCIRRENLLS